MNILVLNPGSSTLKFRLLRMRSSQAASAPEIEAVTAEGIIDRIGTPEAALRVSVTGKPAEEQKAAAQSPAEAAEIVFRRFLPADGKPPDAALAVDAVGYRVVHGGERFREPTRVTPEVLNDIRALSDLAPLHNPIDAAVIETGLRLLPHTPAVAVFDTAFHHTLPDVAALYALPYELCIRHGLRRYGFHGISHRYVSGRLLEILGRGVEGTRVITCHLGNGASVCAVRDGRSVDTSMGLTPLEGLVMGTRSGDVDPGLVLHLMTALGRAAAQVEDLLNHKSGLLGLSGRSGDARDLEEAVAGGDARAALALECFAYRVRKYLGAYAAAMGGLDAVAFAGGIGEHSAVMRARICRDLAFLGLELDAERNREATGTEPACISTEDSRRQAWVIPTDEEGQIARETCALLASPP